MNASRGAAVLLAAAALTVPAALPAAVRARAAPAPPSGGFAWSVRPARAPRGRRGATSSSTPSPPGSASGTRS
ncbi:hypothetical protein [Actinomadura madurae]|uniref:hypothetical protein n=1 Tax=Actinomadura madurae TaxID=1993 RepID=UPI0020D2367E|nr:hypothetical protein [Actinomadura madurae]MCQ0008096.1 hypothetical protein [Actinomadura madurae]